jgi:hypothetical protein
MSRSVSPFKAPCEAANNIRISRKDRLAQTLVVNPESDYMGLDGRVFPEIRLDRSLLNFPFFSPLQPLLPVSPQA